jgi:hypothetical protein
MKFGASVQNDDFYADGKPPSAISNEQCTTMNNEQSKLHCSLEIA